MEIVKDEFRWYFSTTLPNGQKCVLEVDKKYFPKYTRKPKGITREMIIQLAARVIRTSKQNGQLRWVIYLLNSKVEIFYKICPDGQLEMSITLL